MEQPDHQAAKSVGVDAVKRFYIYSVRFGVFMGHMNTPDEIDDEFIPDRTRVRAKWGIAAEPGFGTFPVILMVSQARLGIDAYELNVLMHLIAHWHTAERAPFPHSRTIAKRMNVGIRTVQRCLKSLQEKGFIVRVEKKSRDDRLSYDLRPLAAKLGPLAREWLGLRATRESQSTQTRAPQIREVDFETDIPF
jgi:DNA-binding HxlR family transcriptional regulator